MAQAIRNSQAFSSSAFQPVGNTVKTETNPETETAQIEEIEVSGLFPRNFRNFFFEFFFLIFVINTPDLEGATPSNNNEEKQTDPSSPAKNKENAEVIVENNGENNENIGGYKGQVNVLLKGTRLEKNSFSRIKLVFYNEIAPSF